MVKALLKLFSLLLFFFFGGGGGFGSWLNQGRTLRFALYIMWEYAVWYWWQQVLQWHLNHSWARWKLFWCAAARLHAWLRTGNAQGWLPAFSVLLPVACLCCFHYVAVRWALEIALVGFKRSQNLCYTAYCMCVCVFVQASSLKKLAQDLSNVRQQRPGDAGDKTKRWFVLYTLGSQTTAALKSWNQFGMTGVFLSVPRYDWCTSLSHPSSCMLVNHGPSQQSS